MSITREARLWWEPGKGLGEYNKGGQTVVGSWMHDEKEEVKIK